jgi:aryl-alcohol dehydrogenase-like predicted oxidoreductase
MQTNQPTPSRRPIGPEGPAVSPIGLGLAALGRPGYLNLGHDRDLGGDRSVEALRRLTWQVLDEAVVLGINYLDVARSYGRAEEFVAGWLDDRRPSDVVVGSKWGYVYTADWQIDADTHEVKIHTLENLERQAAESTALLDGYLALYQIHSATLESGVLDDHGILDRLADLRATGLLIGASTSGTGQSDTIRRLLEIERDGRLLFAAVQATWNLLERSAGEALAEAADAGLTVIVKEAVANGRLTGRNEDMVARLEPHLGGRPLDAVAIAAVLSRPWATVVLSGAASVEHLRSNASASTVPADVVDGLPDVAEAPEEYWGRRAGMGWR